MKDFQDRWNVSYLNAVRNFQDNWTTSYIEKRGRCSFPHSWRILQNLASIGWLSASMAIAKYPPVWKNKHA